MLRVPITQAVSGMSLALPALHPKRGNVLLNGGFRLADSHIRKLAELGVQECWIDYPGTEQIRRFISPAILKGRSLLVNLMAEQFGLVASQAHARLDFTEYRNTLAELIEELAMDTASATYIAEIGGRNNSELRHGSEVCHLSILLGLKLQQYLINQRQRLLPREARNLVSLGLGAMLHDVGYLRLDPAVRKRYLTTREQDDAEWQTHVRLGHRMVTGQVRPSVAGVILQHHQYFDGTGFPCEIDEDGRRRGRKGREIHVFARIVAIADHFDRLRRGPDGTLRPRVSVLREMLWGPIAQRFDPAVLAVLPLTVPAYPPGTIIGLSTGEQAIVVDFDPKNPCRPVVQAMPGGELKMNAEAGPIYDLREEPDLAIVKQDGADVRDENFVLVSSGQAMGEAQQVAPTHDG